MFVIEINCAVICRCGSVVNMSPYHRRLQEGVEPTQAWEQSKDDIDENAKYGTWKGDYFLSKPDESGRYCHPLEIRSVGFFVYNVSDITVTNRPDWQSTGIPWYTL